jgi:phosphoribosylamine--glycine ligase
VRETLFGDDAEVDALVYSIYADAIAGRLHSEELARVLEAAGGYPEAYGKGDPISGLNDLDPNGPTVVFHAGTKKSGDGAGVVTNGGRVLAVSSKGKNATEALAATYEALSKIIYPGQYYRRDIGNDLVS